MRVITFAEEIVLLSLDDEGHSISGIEGFTFDLALGGAVLMDLAMRDRIDTDLKSLVMISKEPTGELVLDWALEKVVGHVGTEDARYWVETLAAEGPSIHATCLETLVKRGILRKENERVYWFFNRRRYPVIGEEEQREVKLRLVDILLGNDIPDPRDVVLVALADATGLLEAIFSAGEMDRLRPRIDQISRLDLIGRTLKDLIFDVRATASAALPY
jgi:hypothetical protein